LRISFNTAISCCEKSSAWEAALALLADAESRRLVDVITYNVAGLLRHGLLDFVGPRNHKIFVDHV
jgi:hypothetical protein